MYFILSVFILSVKKKRNYDEHKKLTGKGEQMKEKMVAITARILREKGFKAATVRTIAKEANVNIAAVRYYFGSKEELMAPLWST